MFACVYVCLFSFLFVNYYYYLFIIVCLFVNYVTLPAYTAGNVT